MPKEPRLSFTATHRVSPMATNKLQRSASSANQSSLSRNTAVWSSADDEILLSARASGMNWQPIASKNFPTRTANACRKRHERLMERRNVEDWDGEKLEMLGREYMEVRREMWGLLAARLGERWAVIEAKCMEKGLKNLQNAARSAHKRASADDATADHRGNDDHEGDSGIGVSDAEMEAGDAIASTSNSSGANHPFAVSNVQSQVQPQPQPQALQQTRPLQPFVQVRVPIPPPMPLYEPPPQVWARSNTVPRIAPQPTYSAVRFQREHQSHSPPQSQRAAVSIQSMLASPEVPRA
ncbi:hypothetical protein M8818_006244 [Zalaria obscura]|uniref:Uncharacterized protein n=1 Tax=Zalaria obscura TaxID=2024903 RepID=A0ACC3S7B9_9PEZI